MNTFSASSNEILAHNTFPLLCVSSSDLGIKETAWGKRMAWVFSADANASLQVICHPKIH